MSRNEYSVLMSVYRNDFPKYLEESIMSMVSQSAPPTEIVLVEDGILSSELYEKIDEIISRKIAIKIVKIPQNLGLGKALDIGMRECSYELVARMDADDISKPDRIQKQLKAFDNDPELAIVGSHIDEFCDDPTNIISSRKVPIDNEDIKIFIKRRNPFNHPTVMYKKKAIVAVGGYGALRRTEDLDLFSRLINSGYKGANIDESLLLYRQDENAFIRRKSWVSCSSYIKVQWGIYKRKDCSILDFLYVLTGQLVIFISPKWVVKEVIVSRLREKKKNS